MPELRIQIPKGLDDKLNAAKPDFLDRKSFVCLLLSSAIDKPDTLGISTPGEIPSKAVTTSSKKTFNKRINTPIEQHEELIKEFWKGKGGAKSDTAWKLLMTELEKLQKDHGDAVVREQLQLAINGKWKGIQASRYEQFKSPKGNAPAQTSEPNREYGTGRVFTADDFYGTTNPDNPLTELF